MQLLLEPMTKNRLRTTSLLALTTRNLGSLNCAQLLCPACGRRHLPYGSNLVRCEARDANVVVAFQYKLKIAQFKGGRIP